MNLPAWLAGDEDYRSIARAVQGPMRRWWRRVGVWWISLGFLLTLASITWYLESFIRLNTSQQVRWIPNWFFVHTSLAIFIAGVVWLLAASRSISTFERLTEGAAVTRNEAWRTSVRYRLALTQALWPLILLAFQYFPFPYSFEDILLELPFFPNVLLGMISNLLFWFMSNAVLIAWIAGLLAMRNVRAGLCWLWTIAIFGYPLGNLLNTISWRAKIFLTSMFPAYRELVGPVIAEAISLLGLLLTIGALLLIARRKRLGFVLAYTIGIIGVLSSLDIATRPVLATEIDWTSYVDQFLGTLYNAQGWYQIVGIWYRELDGGFIGVYTPYWQFKFSVPLWLFWVVWPIQAAIAVGYLWLIHFLITRGAAKSAARQAV